MEHRITALRLQKRNRQRVNVYLDGEFAFGLARIVAAWLSVGLEISDEKITELQAEDAREVAYERALKSLNYRSRSEMEIRRDLKEYNVPEDIVEEVLNRLHRAGLVDDERFARNWVENRSSLRPRSQRALAYELQQRGISRQIIEQVIEQVDDDELAYQAALKQAHKLKNLEWQDFRQKMYGFLARRGFNYEVSASVVTRVWAEIDEDKGNEDNPPIGSEDDHFSNETS